MERDSGSGEGNRKLSRPEPRDLMPGLASSNILRLLAGGRGGRRGGQVVGPLNTVIKSQHICTYIDRRGEVITETEVSLFIEEEGVGFNARFYTVDIYLIISVTYTHTQIPSHILSLQGHFGEWRGTVHYIHYLSCLNTSSGIDCPLSILEGKL